MIWADGLLKGEGVGEVNLAALPSSSPLILDYHVHFFHSSSASHSALLLFLLAAAAFLQRKGSGFILTSYANSVSIYTLIHLFIESVIMNMNI